MDGPSVKLKVKRLFNQEMRADQELSPQLLELSTCGLHVVNLGFKTGVKQTGWDLLPYFVARYYLFRQSN